jgi:hypothetical protein
VNLRLDETDQTVVPSLRKEPMRAFLNGELQLDDCTNLSSDHGRLTDHTG